MEEKEIKRILKEFLEKPDNFLDIEYWEGTEIKIDTELKEVIKEIIKSYSMKIFKSENTDFKNCVLEKITVKDYILELLQGKENKYYFFEDDEFYLIDETYICPNFVDLRNCASDITVTLQENDIIYKLTKEV